MAQETPSRDLDKVIVRLPDGMRDELKAAAESNNRSMNAEIVSRLIESFRWEAHSAALEQHVAQMSAFRMALEGQANTLVDMAERYQSQAQAEKARADDLQRRIDRLAASDSKGTD